MLLLVCAKLLAFLNAATGGSAPSGQPAQPAATPVNEFLFSAGLDDLNMFQIVRCALLCLTSYALPQLAAILHRCATVRASKC